MNPHATTGIVDEHVDRTEPGFHFMNEGDAIGCVANVGHNGIDLTPRCLPGYRLNLVASPCSTDGHMETDTASAPRHGAAQPATAAGDNRNFVFVFHSRNFMPRD